jgi:hypothetical protein
MQEVLKGAFSFCLIGRWLIFDLKTTLKSYNEKSSVIANGIRIPRSDKSDFVPVYDFLTNELYKNDYSKLNFSQSIDSIVDSTLDNSDEINVKDLSICSPFKKIKIECKSPIKNKSPEVLKSSKSFEIKSTSTPKSLFKKK